MLLLGIHLILNAYAYEEKVTLSNHKDVCKGLQSFTVYCSYIIWNGFYLIIYLFNCKMFTFLLHTFMGTIFQKTES
jgi:hypothetical protein